MATPQINDGFAKLDWANKHINKLYETWREFAKSGYPILTEDDPKTGNRTFKIGVTSPISEEIPLLIGDAVHNLRSALDHLIYRLVTIATNGKGPFGSLYFPIAETPVDFECRLKRASEQKSASRGVVQRLRPEAIKAIRAIEPYIWRQGRAPLDDPQA